MNYDEEVIDSVDGIEDLKTTDAFSDSKEGDLLKALSEMNSCSHGFLAYVQFGKRNGAADLMGTEKSDLKTRTHEFTSTSLVKYGGRAYRLTTITRIQDYVF